MNTIKLLLMVITGILMTFFGGCMLMLASIGTAVQEASTPLPEHVTQAEFQQLQTSMTYEQVVAIIGGRGEEISGSTIGNVYTSTVNFDAPMGFASVTFSNDALVSKRAYNL